MSSNIKGLQQRNLNSTCLKEEEEELSSFNKTNQILEASHNPWTDQDPCQLIELSLTQFQSWHSPKPAWAGSDPAWSRIFRTGMRAADQNLSNCHKVWSKCDRSTNRPKLSFLVRLVVLRKGSQVFSVRVFWLICWCTAYYPRMKTQPGSRKKCFGTQINEMCWKCLL